MAMQVKITTTVPVDPKHGADEGRIFEVLKKDPGRNGGVWIMGDAGEEVKLLKHEYEELS